VTVLSPDHADLVVNPGPDAAWDDLFFRLAK
jgi:hypothetical protein